MSQEKVALVTARNKLLAPLADLTRLSPSHQELYSRAFNDSVTLLVVGHNYGGI